MKHLISDIIRFPNGCQPVRFVACFMSMLMRAEGMPPCTKTHQALYELYMAVSGFGFIPPDEGLTDAEWNQENNVRLRAFDWYIGYTFDYAGWDAEELIFQNGEREADFTKIKASIDRGIPVLALFGRVYQWVLLTGYDDEGCLYGLDGSQAGWDVPAAAPAGYDENGVFIMPDWHGKGGHAFILGEKKARTVTLRDVFHRGNRIMEYFNIRRM